MKSLKGRKYLDAWCVYFWATTPVIISILTFTTYALLGNKLTAAKVQIVFLIMFKHVQWNPVNMDTDGACHSVLIKRVSILSGLIVEKMYEFFFVGRKETVRYIRVSILSGCQQSRVPVYSCARK